MLMSFLNFLGSGGGSLMATAYNDSELKRGKDIAQSAIMGRIQGKQNVRYSKQLMDYQQMINDSNWLRQNEYDKQSFSRMADSARQAGINPISAIGETSAFSAGAIPSPSASYSGALPNVAGSYGLDPSAFDFNLKQANVRKTNAEAEAQERENMRQNSYDEQLTELFNDVFPKSDKDGEQEFYYVNKGNFDAQIDFALKNNDVSKSDAQAIESEWNKFYYRHLLDDKEAQELFINKFKALCRDAISSADLKNVSLDSAKIQYDIQKMQKTLFEHGNISAFIHKKDKTLDDYLEFFGVLLMNQLQNTIK